MKRFFAILLAVLILLSATMALAEGMDFTSMTDAELYALVNGARNELTKRELVAAENVVIVGQDGITVYMTGNNAINEYSPVLEMEAVVVNDTEKSISVSVESASVNGWNVYGSGIYETTAGKKQKGVFELYLEDSDATTLEEVEDIEIELYIYDTDTYDRIGEAITVTMNLKGE